MAGPGGAWQQNPPLNQEAGLLKFLLPLLILPQLALAQAFDLSTLPADFSFVSIEPGARITMRFRGKEGAAYLFEETIRQSDGTTKTVLVRVNNASQTIYWSYDGQERFFTPHDCGPSRGSCAYVWNDEQGSTDMKSETILVGDIWFSDTFYKSGDNWVFWSRDCTTYDEFGFWIDFVREYADGDTRYGYRERAGENRIDELWQICDPPDFIS